MRGAAVQNDAANIWKNARPLILPFEGMASQIYVLEIPVSQLSAVVDKFVRLVGSPRLVTLEHYTLETEVPFDIEVRSKILDLSEQSTMHQLRGEGPNGQYLFLYIWIDGDAKRFDAEIVFWADEYFPLPQDDVDCSDRFLSLLTLAESFRSDSGNSQCVISARETGDPREDQEKRWTYWW